MSGIDRYVYRQSLTVLAFIAVGLCFAIWLSQSLRLIELIVNRGVSIGTFLYLALLLMPRFLEVVVPIATFAAVLFTYHRMIMDSEMVVLRATGVSQLGLARPALLVAATASLLAFSLSLYLLPTSFRAFKDLQFEIRNNFTSILLQEGVFNTVTEKVTLYIRQMSPNGELLGVLIQDDRQEDRSATLTAERGALAQTDNGPRIVMVNGTRQEFDRKSRRLSVLTFDRYIIELGDARDAPGARWNEPQERYLGELFFPSGSQADRYYGHRLTVEGHQRLLMPLY
ncbi:MAG: LptF/LptG family permease, partial [Alphaproteobacteria bacterium]|nr:LptF/LptG family permease [Alphaproteobacteria bacterium]